MPLDSADLPESSALPEMHTQAEALPLAEADRRRKRERLDGAVINGAVKLLPLVALLDKLQPQLAQDSVFHLRRLKLQAHVAAAYAELQSERPRRQALVQAFQTLTDLVQAEIRDIHRDEVKQAAKEVALATLRHAPALINAAHQARLLS